MELIYGWLGEGFILATIYAIYRYIKGYNKDPIFGFFMVLFTWPLLLITALAFLITPATKFYQNLWRQLG